MLRCSPLPRRPYRRRGLTLLEMVVVIAILIVMAGILVPLLPNMLLDAHTANGSTNIDELDKSVQAYEALNRKSPDGFDSMLATDGSVPSEMLFKSNAAFSAYPLTASDVTSLSAAGITKVYDYNTALTGFNPTFNNSTTTARVLAADGKVLQVTAAEVQAKLGQGNPADVKYTYVCFGVGELCSLIGAKRGGIAQAPVRGTPQADKGPDKTYGRYCLIYRLDGTTSAATFVAACCPGMDGLGTSDTLIQKYYDNQKL